VHHVPVRVFVELEALVLEVDYVHENDSDRADKTGSAHPYLPTGQQPGQSLMPAPDTRSVSCSGKWKNYRGTCQRTEDATKHPASRSQWEMVESDEEVFSCITVRK
jgi:hypothetical protein